MDFGSHTKTHAYLPDINDINVLRDEIAGSEDVIEEHLGKKVRVFCYFSGGFTGGRVDIVKGSGYERVCATNRGLDPRNRNVFGLRRIKVFDQNLFIFRGQVIISSGAGRKELEREYQDHAGVKPESRLFKRGGEC